MKPPTCPPEIFFSNFLSKSTTSVNILPPDIFLPTDWRLH